MRSRSKRPIPIAPPPVRSRKRARQVTTRFHRLSAVESSLIAEAEKGTDTTEELQKVRDEIKRLGGREAYQQASVFNTNLCRNTTRFVISTLLKHKLRPGRGNAPLEVLEVGAINTQLINISWLHVHAIDLNSQHPSIQQMDFFDLIPRGNKDVVVSSMVINSVPSPDRRGEMLRDYRRHLKLGGNLFLALPAMCLTHSPHIDEKQFCSILSETGFKVIEIKRTPKIFHFHAQAIVCDGDSLAGLEREDVRDSEVSLPTETTLSPPVQSSSSAKVSVGKRKRRNKVHTSSFAVSL